MKIIFRETTNNAISLHSIRDFYRAAQKVCNESFVVEPPEDATEIKVIHIEGQYTPVLVFIIEITKFHSNESQKLAIQRLINLAEGYNWVHLISLEDNKKIEDDKLVKLYEESARNQLIKGEFK